MSFWSSQTLKSKFKELNIVDPYNEDDIESGSYNLTLGDEVYISFLPDTSQKDRKKVILKDKDTVAIPPGQFAFLITAEKVTIPKNIIAFISIKFKSKAKMFLVFMSILVTVVSLFLLYITQVRSTI